MWCQRLNFYGVDIAETVYTNDQIEVCTETLMPVCDFSLSGVSFDYEHDEATGEQIFTPYFSTSIGQFCPDFTITSELYKDDSLIQSVTNKGTQGDSDSFNTIKKDFLDDGEGYYWIDFKLSAIDYYGMALLQQASTESILAMTPDCVISMVPSLNFETVPTNSDEVVETFGL